MTDEMLVAGEAWLPQYKVAIAEAKKRMSESPSVPVNKGYEGAARIKTKSIEEMKNNEVASRKNATQADKGKDRGKQS